MQVKKCGNNQKQKFYLKINRTNGLVLIRIEVESGGMWPWFSLEPTQKGEFLPRVTLEAKS